MAYCYTMYIDELLYRLSESHMGCYIGNTFHGAFGYADDIILLSPSIHSLDALLNICSEYALEYNVLFNSSKSKLIVYNQSSEPRVEFMGGVIDVVNHEKHLGNVIGNLTQRDIISRITNDFLTRVNMVKSHFKNIPTDTMYFLFKTYCMPLYGSQLWDLGSTAMNIFYVAWRKSVRYLLNIPRRTHCSLLHYICDDVPINIQLCIRFIKFLLSLPNTNNPLIKTCHELIMQGSQSAVSNSLSFTANALKCNRRYVKYADAMKNTKFDNDDAIKCSLIRDILDMQYQKKCGHLSLLEAADLEYLLNILCVE